MAAESNVDDYFSGNDMTLIFTAVDEETGLALNLSGAVALEWKLAKSATAAPIISKALSAGVTITDATAGKFEVEITAADTEPLKGIYYYEVRLTNSFSKKSTLAYGSFTILVNLVRD